MFVLKSLGLALSLLSALAASSGTSKVTIYTDQNCTDAINTLDVGKSCDRYLTGFYSFKVEEGEVPMSSRIRAYDSYTEGRCTNPLTRSWAWDAEPAGTCLKPKWLDESPMKAFSLTFEDTGDTSGTSGMGRRRRRGNAVGAISSDA